MSSTAENVTTLVADAFADEESDDPVVLGDRGRGLIEDALAGAAVEERHGIVVRRLHRLAVARLRRLLRAVTHAQR